MSLVQGPLHHNGGYCEVGPVVWWPGSELSAAVTCAADMRGGSPALRQREVSVPAALAQPRGVVKYILVGPQRVCGQPLERVLSLQVP